MNLTRLQVCFRKVCAFLLKRNHQRWALDEDFFKSLDGPVMYPDQTVSQWKIPPYNPKQPPKELKVRNTVLNWGPAHPAAHGCLRLVMHLEGEVRNFVQQVNKLMSCVF